MHEQSLVRSMIEQVCEEQRSRHLGPIVEIQLEIGEFSGIDSTLFESAFAQLSGDCWRQPVRLRIENVPLTAACCLCQKEFHVQRFNFICPYCQNRDVDLIKGEDVRICHLVTERLPSGQGTNL